MKLSPGCIYLFYHSQFNELLACILYLKYMLVWYLQSSASNINKFVASTYAAQGMCWLACWQSIFIMHYSQNYSLKVTEIIPEYSWIHFISSATMLASISYSLKRPHRSDSLELYDCFIRVCDCCIRVSW